LSAENGDRLHDLPAYTREVMARAEAALGTKLQWVAVDHHDTDNPHTHLIIRGRRANGQDLVLPRDFIKYGFAGVARDVATDWLGARTPADERLALGRDVARHGPTRLDRMLAFQIGAGGELGLANIASPTGDPDTTRALKQRARELERMGLARETRRNVLAFQADWHDRLKAMELHLDIRKRIVLERSAARTPSPSIERIARGLLGR
jgi:type IV secretory pathway VirD2 relaxase